MKYSNCTRWALAGTILAWLWKYVLYITRSFNMPLFWTYRFGNPLLRWCHSRVGYIQPAATQHFLVPWNRILAMESTPTSYSWAHHSALFHTKPRQHWRAIAAHLPVGQGQLLHKVRPPHIHPHSNPRTAELLGAATWRDVVPHAPIWVHIHLSMKPIQNS